MAELYGLRPLGEGTHLRDLSKISGRRGFLTQAAVIAAQTPTAAPSIVDRGLFVSRTLLCQDVPPPPANVAANLQDIPEDLPERERLSRHTSDPACAACHQVFDPYGYALQRYDAMGRLRKVDDHGHPIPPGGVMLLDGGLRSYRNVHEFLALLAESPGVERCLVESVLEYAYGRALGSADQATVAALLAQFSQSGHDALDLFTAVATSPDYRKRSAAEQREDP
jgi:hypothetical protein